MPSWSDKVNLKSCLWFEGEDKSNSAAAILAGILFSVGWWLMIDATFVYPAAISSGHYVCGILGTISLIMVNSVSKSQIHGDGNYAGGYFGPNGAQLWFFVGFVLGFLSVIASFLIFADLVRRSKEKVPGVELLLQNILILASSIIYRFGRVEKNTW
ncbi:transmembrane protein 50B-like [Planococcus citri]|uniref:transmembrane protein 50B-like n=1 Tax=Planococcus citri TaxID=170843 RepID=UPI0031F950E5